MHPRNLVLLFVLGAPSMVFAQEPTTDDAVVAPVTSPFGAPRPAVEWEPNTPEIRFEAASRTVMTDDIGFETLGDNKNVSLADVAISGRVFRGLSVGLRYVGTERQGDTAALYDIAVDLNGADLLARYTLDLIPWVAPYAEVGVGLRIGDLEANSESGELGDVAYAPAFDGAVGVQVAYPLRHVSIGVFTDHGYQYTGELAFDDVELRVEESDAAPVDLGGLEMSGYRWRMGVALAYRF